MAAIAELMDVNTLSRGECLRLLAAGSIGRVVCTDGALPSAEPVSYLLDDEEIVFRAGTGSRLAAAARDAVVAFQADAFDAATATGWSVLGVGKAYEVTGDDRVLALTSQHQLVHTHGHHAHVIAIPLWRLSGRRLMVSGPEEEPGPH